MSDLERGRPKDYADGEGINGNRGTAQQVKIVDSTPKWVLILAIVLAFLAIVLSFGAMLQASQALRDAADSLRASSDAAVSADRADRAERRANIAEAYAKQVYVELNRLGYPVQTPIEEHSQAPTEAHKP